MRSRPRLAAVLAALIAVAVVVAIALPRGSGSAAPQSARASQPAQAAAKAVARPKLRRRHPQAVEPVAGESGAVAALPADGGSNASDTAPSQAASSAKPEKVPKYDSGPTGDAAVSNADVLRNGIALPPIEAPEEVRNIVRAGNQIARTRYLWGGGHGRWLDKGYDCSGSVSYALASAGFLNAPLDSGRLMGWGKPGKGKWVTIYANAGHVFMVVAGVRFDTSGNRKTGSRWQADMRPTGGFAARHPVGF